MSEISVVIHTKNSAKTLRKALESVVHWADEVIVLDMQSTDETVDIAEKFDVKVYKTKDYGFTDPARNEGIQKARGPWIFFLDADEEIPQTLADQLRVLSENQGVHGYYLPRKNMIFGQWAKTGWWPDYIPRFMRKDSANWPPVIHAKPIIKGNIEYLEPKEEFAIVHHNYTTIDEFVERLNRYTTIAAKSEAKDIPLLEATYGEFIRRYYQSRGYEQGKYGLSLSLLQMCYECILAMKRWEKAGMQEDGEGDQVDDEFELMYQHLCYWIAEKHIQQEKSFIKKLYWRVRRKLKV